MLLTYILKKQKPKKMEKIKCIRVESIIFSTYTKAYYMFLTGGIGPIEVDRKQAGQIIAELFDIVVMAIEPQTDTRKHPYLHYEFNWI